MTVDVRLASDWRAKIEQATRPEWEQAADELEDRAAQNAPTRTGTLRRSIAGDVIEGPFGMFVEAVASAPYALYVEEGTSRMDAQPFLKPALMTVVARRYGGL